MPTGDNPQPSRTLRLTRRGQWAARMGDKLLLAAPCAGCHTMVEVRPTGVYDAALGGQTHDCTRALLLGVPQARR